MKKISVIAALMPLVVWSIWFLAVRESLDALTLSDANKMAFFMSVFFAIFSAVFIKKLKWYYLCNLIFITTHGIGFYKATTEYLLTVNNQILLGTQKDASQAVLIYTLIIMLVCAFAKTYLESYEYMSGGKKK